MSTNNFSWENILVAIEDPTDEDGEYCEDCDWFWNDKKENIQNVLLVNFKNGVVCDKYESNSNSNFEGTVLFEIDFHTTKWEHYKTIEIVLRNGYFSGANLDYNIVDSKDYVEKVYKTIEKKIDNTIKKLRKILPTLGTELVQLGTMSNGEGVYKVANKLPKK